MQATQMTFEDVAQDRAFSLRERDAILDLIGDSIRLTKADRAALVQQAVQAAGPSADLSQVNALLRQKIESMLRPLSNEEIQATAVVMSPCRAHAVLPMSERVFYQFVNRQFSPSVRGIFLWERFVEQCPNARYVEIHRLSYAIDRGWWPTPCLNLMTELRRAPRFEPLRRFEAWKSFGIMDRELEPLVAMMPDAFPKDDRVILSDEMAAALDRMEAQCAR